MAAEIHTPNHPFLHYMINHIMFQEIGAEDLPAEWMRILPNATTNLCFTLYSDLHSMEYGEMRNNMSTTCIRPVTFNSRKSIRMMVVQFKPHTFHLFTGVPMKNLTNEFPAHDDFFPASRLEALYDALHHAGSNKNRVIILENFLVDTWRVRQSDPRMIFLTSQLTDEPGCDMDSLAASANMSSRRMRDLFMRHVGISPKYFSKLKRFNQAIRTILMHEDASLTSIALNLGYYDQSHFIHSFREFADISPREFRKMNVKTADFYNFPAVKSTTLV